MALILVVDDSEDLLEMYGEILALSGHGVTTATDAEVGLELVKTRRPDVILLDMMMPGVDGLEFLARLQRECPAPPPVVAHSGFDGYREEALRRGACAFLRKPVDVDDLCQAVESVFTSAKVSEQVLVSNEEKVRASRRRAAEEATLMMAVIDREGTTNLRPSLEGLVEWLWQYYGFGVVFLFFLRGAELCVEAVRGAPELAFSGTRYPRQVTYCDDVIDAGSTLCLPDPSRHSSFSKHGDVSTSDWRFYIGAPLTTPDKVVIGTLCLADWHPHEMYHEDMRLVEGLALNVARAVKCAVEDGREGILGVDRSGVVDRPLLELLLEVALARAARTGGEIRLVAIELEPESQVEAVVATVRRIISGVQFAVARLRPGWLALLHGGEDADAVQRTMKSVLDEIEYTVCRKKEASWRRQPSSSAEEGHLSAERIRSIKEEILCEVEP